MDLSGMMTGMLKDQAVNAIASKLGLENGMAKSLISKALPTILSGLQSNAKDPEKAELLEQAISKKHDGSLLANLGDVNLDDGNNILGHIFGGKKEAAMQESGNPEVMKALAPMVMGMLGKAKKESGSTASDMLKDDSMVMGMAKSFLDKDGDGDIKDDLLGMAMGFLGKK